MERLTHRLDGGEAVLHAGYANYTAVQRLAAYEDTGLTPEEIEREALLNALLAEGCYTFRGLGLLKRFPAADVAPVVHGRWEALRRQVIGSEYRCSECHRIITVSGDKSIVDTRAKKLYPYCHCGAKMDEEEIKHETV